MANIKSVRKRAKQALERREHNVALRTSVRSAIKKVTKAVAAGNKEAALAVRRDGMHERRILHAMIAAEGGHHAAQPLGPVAGPERLAVLCQSLNDEFRDCRFRHARDYRG